MYSLIFQFNLNMISLIVCTFNFCMYTTGLKAPFISYI